MWIVLLNFFLFLLLFGFFCHGVKSWFGVVEPADEAEKAAFENEQGLSDSGAYFALWALVIGLSASSVLKALIL